MTTSSDQLDELCINTIRTLSMDAVQKANSGHPGTAMALAPLAYVLYTRVMRHNPSNPDWADRDRFVLSAGHASVLLYSMLYLTGYPMTLEDIKNFRQVGSPTAGHPERKYSPGIEATTGPLGQGLSMSVGLALAERMLAARFNQGEHPLVDHHTFTIASDGDIQEGVAAEACSLAGHLGLGRLIAFYDANKIQLASEVDVVMTEDVGERFEAYGWHVVDIGDDLSVERLESVTREAMAAQDQPSLIIVESHIGYGSPLQDSTKAHGNPLGEDNVRITKENYGWDPDAHFLVPDEALAHFRECCERGAEQEREWSERFDTYREEHPDEARAFSDMLEGRMPDGFDTDPPRFEAGESMATRKASGTAIQWAAERVPHLVGGAADLASSTNTDIDGSPDVQRGSYEGRNLRFGVREHGMGAIVNGLTLHGFRGYGSTFLIFSDYMRGRPAAVGPAEAARDLGLHARLDRARRGRPDAPADRAARRPARDAAPADDPPGRRERDGARLALRAARRPRLRRRSRSRARTCPSSTRTACPTTRSSAAPTCCATSANGGDPELILIATGSEVSLAMEAAEQLDGEGVGVRVVSMPCMDTFTEADEAYRDEVLPPACRARVAIEAASPMGWYRWVGADGAFIGMETFGESGPYKDVYEHFGITVDRIAETARAVIGRATAVRS